MKRLILTAAAIAILAACEPDYAETAGRSVTDEHLEVTGGADPTAISGGAPADSAHTIHHPAADGNAGRASDDPTGAAIAAPEGAGHQESGTGR